MAVFKKMFLPAFGKVHLHLCQKGTAMRFVRKEHTLEDYQESEKTLIEDIREALSEFGPGQETPRIRYGEVVEAIRCSDIAAYFDYRRYDQAIRDGHRPDLRSMPFRWKGYVTPCYDDYIVIYDFGEDFPRRKDHSVKVMHGFYRYDSIPQLLKTLREMLPICKAMSERYSKEETGKETG